MTNPVPSPTATAPGLDPAAAGAETLEDAAAGDAAGATAGDDDVGHQFGNRP